MAHPYSPTLPILGGGYIYFCFFHGPGSELLGLSPDARDRVCDGAFGGVGDEEVVVGKGVVVTSSSLEMLTNSCLGGIMVSLIFLEGLEEEA
nr:hypothetical protein [Tanacetum cinerariifolium]